MKLIFLSLLALPSAQATTLEEAYRAAFGKSESLAQSKLQANQAEDRLDQATGKLLPNLSLKGLHQTQPEPSDPSARGFSPRDQTTINFALEQPLFRGGSEFAGLRNRRAERDAQLGEYDKTARKLFVDVATNYLEVLRLEQDLANLEEQTAIYDQRVTELGARVRRGESNTSELLSAQSTQASVAAELRLVQGQIAAAREQFSFLTGLADNSQLIDPNVLAQGPKTIKPLNDYLAHIEERPDVRSSRDKFRAADEGVGVAWGAHLPSIDLLANYYLKRPGFLSSVRWDAGIKVTIPLFEGGATQAKVREAVSVKAQAELELTRIRRTATQEIRSAYERLQARLDHLQALEKAAELAEKNSTLLRRDYRRGLSRNIDVQIALTEYRTARRNYDKARFDSELEYFQLQSAASLTPQPGEPSP